MATPRKTSAAIYALHRGDGVIRYIGKANDPAKRVKGHISASVVGGSNKDRWVASAHRDNDLRVTILEWAVDWTEAEPRWIAHGREAGWPLLNIAAGGEMTDHLHSPTIKAKRDQSPFRKVIHALTFQAENARRDGFLSSYENMRACIVQLRQTAKFLKKRFGEDDFTLWAWWLFSQFPMDRSGLSPERCAWLDKISKFEPEPCPVP